MDQRTEFALKAINCPDFAALCRDHGISRKTGYKWQARFMQRGLAGMAELSRRPHGNPKGLAESVLERAGLTLPRKTRPAGEGGRIASGLKAAKPNEVWTVDFKGWWRGAGGLKIEPLTVRDEYSRMLLEMRDLPDSCGGTVRACFERLFERHGLPGAIRSDNGPPFASHNGLLGLTRLSAWWLALGIGLERSRPGCPQDNGAHERMHRDIRVEIQSGRAGQDQAAFDLWRDQYNNERPHEALGMRVPSELYVPSGRPFEGTPEALDYGGMETRRVKTSNGRITYRSESMALSTALGGWDVGLSPRADGLVEVRFAQLLIGHINPETASFAAVRPDHGKAGQEDKKV